MMATTCDHRGDRPRVAAARAVADGYRLALSLLDPDDVEEIGWYRARYRDACKLAKLAPHTPRHDEQAWTEIVKRLHDEGGDA